MKKKIFKIIATVLILVIVFFISLPTLLNKAGLHPDYNSKKYSFSDKKAVIISTSHSILSKPGETTGKLTGVFASELTVPYYEFTDSGFEVDIASIKGGEIPIDPESFFYAVKTNSDDRYLEDQILKEKVKNSILIDQLEIDNYDIVFISGGWGAAYDLGYSETLGEKISQAYYNPNSIIGYIMMEGLQSGDNLTWALNIQKKITKYVDLNLNYFARKSDYNAVVHNGSVQLKANF